MGEHKRKAKVEEREFRPGTYRVGGGIYTLSRFGTVHRAVVRPGARVHVRYIVEAVRHASVDIAAREKREREEMRARAAESAPAREPWWRRLLLRLHLVTVHEAPAA